MTETSPPQLTFSLGNPGAPNTVYITDDPSKNALTLELVANAAVALTPGTPVAQSDAPSASGSLLYLDLSALGIDAEDFGKFALDLEGWVSKAFPADGQLCISPTAATSLAASQPVPFTLTGFVLPDAPSAPTAALKLDTYRAPPVARGVFPAVVTTQVAATPPPGGQADLHQVLAAALAPQIVATSQAGTPPVSNKLALTLSAISGEGSAKAGDNTVFTLSVVYASDPNGYGALLTTNEGATISIPVPQGGGWTPSNIDGLEGRSWQLVPTSGAALPSAGEAPVSFDLSPIVTYFQPGPTALLLSYSGVPGYADGAFALTLLKEPHVRIDSFTATPSLTPLSDGSALVELTWSTANAGTLVLDPIHADVTGRTKFQANIKDTTLFTLTAYGPGSSGVDNIAFANAKTIVVPVLDSFSAAPGAVSVDDLQAGQGSVALRWAVNAPTKSTLELTSSVTGPYATQFAPVGMTTLNLAQPQMFTLNVTGDPRPEDMWRLYVPTFTLASAQPAGAKGGYAVAAPGASYVAVSQSDTDLLVILSTASYAQIASLKPGHLPQGLVFTPDGSTIYVANQGDGSIGVVNVTASAGQTPPWTFSSGTSISVGGAPARVALAPADYLYATVGNSSGAGSLAMVTLADGSVNQVTVGRDPQGLAVSASGAQVFVANRGDGTVSQIGIAPDGTPQLVRTLTGLPGAWGLTMTPDGNTLLVACSDGTVQLLDATAPDTSPRVPIVVGGRPTDIALDPSGVYAFVSDSSGGRVSLINVDEHVVVGTPVSVAANPLGVSVSPDGMLVFVGNVAALNVLTLRTYQFRSNPPNCGGYVTNVNVSADGKSAYAWADASATLRGATPASGLHVYDVASETLRPALPGLKIIDLAVASAATNVAFLSQLGQSALYPFDGTTLKLGAALVIPAKGSFTKRQPLALAAAEDASRVFALVSDGQNQFSVVVFSLGPSGYVISDDVTAYVAATTPIEPKLASAPDGSAAYVYDGTHGNLWPITLSGSNFAKGSALELGSPAVAGLLASPDGSKLYVAGQQQLATAFFIVDCVDWTVERLCLTEPVTTLAVRAMALSPDGTRILVSDPAGGTIRFIDATSIRFLQTLTDDGRFKAPTGVVMTPDQSRLFVADQSGLFATAIQIRVSARQE